MLVYIKNKEPGMPDCLFRLSYPQRKYCAVLEELRTNNKPIRICMCKARQWGGSTETDLYMAWLQLIHKPSLNGIIVAHVNSASEKIKGMYRKMLDAYPIEMLHEVGEPYDVNEKKLVWDGNSDNTQRIPQRNCTISVGSSQSPNSGRSGDYALAHFSEVGFFIDSEKIHPEDLIRSVTSGILYRPYTMIVYESTADGVGTFFHNEYKAAAENLSQFKAFFIAWYEIENYRIPFNSKDEEAKFAEWLYNNRNSDSISSDREEPGKYLWWLWEAKGATLEAINWYITERTKYSEHGKIAAEYPSDAIEAFVNSGSNVFDKYLVENLRKTCKPPLYVGEIYGDADEGEKALSNVRFQKDSQGNLHIWSMPEHDPDEEVTDRYLTVVDIGGRSSKADWSVIAVFDRFWMMDGGKPCVVAQWYGHIDMDLLAWKAAQISTFYDNALLVIESNTLETHDKNRQVDGDQSQYILCLISDVYPNLYARKQSEDQIREGAPTKWGFHTNVYTKPMIISNLVRIVRDSAYTERDSGALDEMIIFERKPNGSTGAAIGGHDDKLMTRAIGLHICYNEMEMPKIRKRNGNRNINYTRHVVSAATI
ncbi:terminase large subunit [gut metagenome]|uniref:Terminase large subunit n=1 Tax=gut metagenome TaxID=749906 RepID=J9FXQ0_9ZZZZ